MEATSRYSSKNRTILFDIIEQKKMDNKFYGTHGKDMFWKTFVFSCIQGSSPLTLKLFTNCVEKTKKFWANWLSLIIISGVIVLIVQ